MSILPSPIPHPLDYCPWDVPGWIYEALDWVVGVEWPDGNERAVWELADQWYGAVDVLTRPRDDATTAAGEVRSGYGGVGLVAEAFDTSWRKIAEGEDAPLHVLFGVTSELGKLVESCGCDIEGAKLEAWIELGLLVIELLSLAVAAVLTAGAASPAAGAAITASRLAVQQIFKRLVAQLARKAIKEGLKEASERAAKEVVKSGVRGLARRAAIGGLVEAGQEAGTSLATQAYQNSTGRRDGLDLTDVGMSGLGGFAGGAAAPLAGLGRHAHGRLAEIGEHVGREMAGETLAESAAGLATGQGVSLEELARAAVSGVSGSATGQADTALHRRLDGRLADLTTQPVGLPLPDTTDLIPAQRTAEPVGVPADTQLAESAHRLPAQPEAAASLAVLAGDGSINPHESPADPALSPVGSLVDPDGQRPHVEVAATPTLSSVAVESAAPGQHLTALDARSGPVHVSATAEPGVAGQPVPTQASAVPAVAPGPPSVAPAPNGPGSIPTDRSSVSTLFPQSGPQTTARPGADPFAGPSVGSPERRPTPNPRFPLLAALAPAPHRPAHGPTPATPGPFDPLPPRSREEWAARLAADREALDRRRYQGYFNAQREWYEDKRRAEEADWHRLRADLHERRVHEWDAQASELRRVGRDLLAERYRHAAYEYSVEARELRELARQTLAGEVVPEQVTVEDDADFHRINDDVADLAPGAVETPDHSALTGDGHPPPIDRSRRYGTRGGLRPPLALHQTDLERQMPRNPDGSVVRTADPRYGGWFQLANDGGPQADATRGINCLDCTLSLYETWVHGRPRVSAPRTFDGYLAGDVHRPVDGEADGPVRVEETTGGRFQDLCPGPAPTTYSEAQQAIERGYRDLHGQLLAGGHGSYAFLITSYEGGGSHAWVALNQNGAVLFLDPQNGLVSDRPIYRHRGVPHGSNVIGIDALVLGPDGRPMPLAGRPPGIFNSLPDPLERPAPPQPPQPPAPYDGEDVPDFNHVHLLGADTTFHRSGDTSWPGSAANPEPDQIAVRQAHRAAHAERIAAGLFVRDVVAVHTNLDDVFAAGVTPVELAQHVDVPALRRLVPGLDETAAGEVARLCGDPRVRQMLDRTWEAPPRGGSMLAERLVHQLAQRPDLARMMLATGELADSLTARPVTLHHLAGEQKAIDVLGEVLRDVAEHGVEPFGTVEDQLPHPTPLTPEQRQITAQVATRRQSNLQLGFELARRDDEHYRLAYVERLYAEAAAVQPDLNRIAGEAAGERGRPDWRTGPKRRDRVLDKLVEYQNDASRLKDLAAARVEFDHLDDVYRALGRLAADPDVLILDIKDRFVSPQRSGYRDILLNLGMASGHVAELRLQLAPLEGVAGWEHSLYEVRRDLEALSESDGRPLTKMERAIRHRLLLRVQDAYRRALDVGLGGVSQR